jgi:hypothetical protein
MQFSLSTNISTNRKLLHQVNAEDVLPLADAAALCGNKLQNGQEPQVVLRHGTCCGDKLQLIISFVWKLIP